MAPIELLDAQEQHRNYPDSSEAPSAVSIQQPTDGNIVKVSNGEERIEAQKNAVRTMIDNCGNDYLREAAMIVMLEACANGDLREAKSIKYLFWLDEDFLKVTPQVRSAFIRACQNGDHNIVDWISRTFNLSSKDVHCDDHRALLEACRAGHFYVVRWIVETFYY